jgi:hypothetical protein
MADFRTPNETKKIDEQRFEFVLYINNHIICQRYFNIRDYNERSLNSYEMKELMDSICGMKQWRLWYPWYYPRFPKEKIKRLFVE